MKKNVTTNKGKVESEVMGLEEPWGGSTK